MSYKDQSSAVRSKSSNNSGTDYGPRGSNAHAAQSNEHP